MTELKIPCLPTPTSAFMFTIHGTPIAWSAPDIGTRRTKGGRKYRFCSPNLPLRKWQAFVSEQARKAYGPIEPSMCPIRLHLTYHVEHDDPATWGRIVLPDMKWCDSQAKWNKCGRTLADITNLTKAIEDALETVFFHNDTQVRCKSELSLWAESSRVDVMVGFLPI